MRLEEAHADDAASPVTFVDALGQVLSRVDDPGRMGEHVTAAVRELTGARCVTLIQCPAAGTKLEHSVVSADPVSWREWAGSPAAQRLYDTVHRLPEARLVRADESSEIAEHLSRDGFGISMVMPLRLGDLRLGAVLILGLPDERHASSALALPRDLSTIVALVLRNASLSHRQERAIRDRTSELQRSTEQLESELAERRRAEDGLRESEAKYRRIVDTATEGIWAIGPDATTTFVNARMAEMLGYSREEMIGRPATDFVFEEDMPDHLRRMRTRRRGVPENYDRRFRRKDGQTVWTLASATPILDERRRFKGAFAMFTDITDRKKAEDAQRRLNRELRAISSCNQFLMRAQDEQTLLDDICHIVCDEAGYQMAWVGYAVRDDARTVHPAAWAGVEGGYLADAHITWADTERGRGPTGTAIRTGGSVCIQDFATDPLAAPWRENALRHGYRSSIALPLKDESADTFGALNIYSTEPNAFTPDEVRLLEELAADLAFGVTILRDRARLEEAEGTRLAEREKAEAALLLAQDRLEAVRRTGAMAGSTLDLGEVLRRILAGTLEATGASVGMVFLKDMETGCLSWGASIGLSEAFVAAYKERLIKPGEGLSGRIAQTGEVIYIERDSSHDPRIARPVVEAEGLNSFIGVPIRAEAEIVGVMNILTRPPDVLSQDDTVLIDAIGTHVGSSLRNAQLFAEWKKLEGETRESEARYRRIVDTATEGIWVIGADTMTTFVNARMAEMLGRSAEEMNGRPVTDFMFEEDAADHLRRMENRRRGLSEHYERRFRRKDGRTVWALASATPVLDDTHRFRGSFAMFSDITGMKHAEEELRERDLAIRRAYVDVIAAVTGNKLILMTSDEVEHALGEPLGRSRRITSYRSLSGARAYVRGEIAEHLPDTGDLDDFLVGVGEGLTNAIKHAGGGRYGVRDRDGVAQVVISDSGPGVDFTTVPRATLEAGFSTCGTLGMGFTMMLEMSDRVLLSTQGGSTVLVLELGR